MGTVHGLAIWVSAVRQEAAAITHSDKRITLRERSGSGCHTERCLTKGLSQQPKLKAAMLSLIHNPCTPADLPCLCTVMVSQKGEEGTCACHQESLQTPNEQSGSDCAATSNSPAAFAPVVAFGLCREHKALRQNSSQGAKRAGKAAREGLAVQGSHWECRDCKLPTKLNKVIHTHSASCSWVLSATGASGELH